MVFTPFGGTDQTLFFRVPTSDNDRAFGLPSGLEQFAEAVDGLKHRGRTAVRIDRSVDPSIAVIACNDPFVGRGSAANFADDIPDSAVLVILFEVHFHF